MSSQILWPKNKSLFSFVKFHDFSNIFIELDIEFRNAHSIPTYAVEKLAFVKKLILIIVILNISTNF